MGYLARDVMHKNLIAVHEDTDLRDLAKLFLEKAITGAPVVDDNGDMVGVVSQTDLIYYSLTRDDELRMSSDFYHNVRIEGQHLQRGFQIEDVNTGRASDVMTPVVHSVTETATVESVARLMTRRHIHRVVVRKGLKATGIISALDVLKVLGVAKRNAGSKATTRRVAARKPATRKTTTRKAKGKTKAKARRTARTRAGR